MHTPSPWQVVGSNVYGNNLRAILPMNAADARLIAAAPDMLEALKLAAEINPYGSVENAAARDAARAAIAKARGEI